MRKIFLFYKWSKERKNVYQQPFSFTGCAVFKGFFTGAGAGGLGRTFFGVSFGGGAVTTGAAAGVAAVVPKYRRCLRPNAASFLCKSFFFILAKSHHIK